MRLQIDHRHLTSSRVAQQHYSLILVIHDDFMQILHIVGNQEGPVVRHGPQLRNYKLDIIACTEFRQLRSEWGRE